MNKSLIVIIVLGVLAFSWFSLKDKPVRTPTSADNAPPGSLHNLPVPEAVAKVRSKVAAELGISEGLVIIQSVSEKEWANSCLGVNKPDLICAQVITPGYEVIVEAEGKTLKYRTNIDSSVIYKEQ